MQTTQAGGIVMSGGDCFEWQTFFSISRYFFKYELKYEIIANFQSLEYLQYLMVPMMHAAQGRLRQSNTGHGNPY